MSLRGDLQSFSVGDILRTLAAAAKTGCLYIDGDRGEAQVWVANGGLVRVATQGTLRSAPGDEVLFDLLRCRRGSFTFEPGAPAPRRRLSAVNLDLLDGADRLLHELRELTAVVPSLHHWVVLRPALGVPEVTLESQIWSTVAAIGTGRSIAQLADLLQAGKIETLRRVKDLVEIGVATIAGPDAAAPRDNRTAIKRRARSDSSDRADQVCPLLLCQAGCDWGGPARRR